MAPFQYVPWSAPDIPSIASLIAHQADPYARAAEATAAANAHAREVSGDVWGRAIQQIGQLPTQLAAQARETADAAQKRALLGTEIEKNQQDVAARQQAVSNQKLLATLVQQHTGEDGTTDHEAVSRDYASQTGDTQRAQQYLKGYEDIATSVANLRKANQQRVGDYAIAIGRAANTASDYGEFMTRIDHLVVGKAITPEERQDILQQTQAGAQDWPALKAHLVKTADGYAPTKNLKDGETEYGGVSNQPVVSAPKKLTNDTELLMAAADPTHPQHDQAVRALDLQKSQKNPPSLEDQYLKALADGKTETAATIRQVWEDKAKASRDPNAAAQLAAIRNLSQQEAQARLDDRDQTSEKNQSKKEQDYRTVLVRAASSRSGGLGLEDAKVQQANHLIALLDQSFDAKTGDWNIPRVQLNELALGLARLTSPGGQAGEGMLKEFQQRTAKGDLAGALTFLTGEPIAANTQAITKYLKDSIERQGQTAEQNREGEMRYLRGLAPTDLAESRRTALEANTLNPLRQSKVLTNDKGDRRLVVSTDGGRTWR